MRKYIGMSKGIIKSPESRQEKLKRQLNHILSDIDYYMTDNSKEFTTSMYNAIGNRKITPKMEISMDNIVSRYKRWLKSENKLSRHEQREFVEGAVAKIALVRTLLASCDYSPSYVIRSELFLESVQSYVKKHGKLSLKQRKALNQMYKRFQKKVGQKGIHNVQISMKTDNHSLNLVNGK